MLTAGYYIVVDDTRVSPRFPLEPLVRAYADEEGIFLLNSGGHGSVHPSPDEHPDYVDDGGEVVLPLQDGVVTLAWAEPEEFNSLFSREPYIGLDWPELKTTGEVQHWCAEVLFAGNPGH